MKYLLLLLLATYCYSNRMVYDHKSNLFMGMQDSYSESLQSKRILEVNNTFSKEIFDSEKLDVNLGVADWGPISTSLLMTESPKDYNMSSPPCRITTPDMSYNILNVQKLPQFDDVYDYVVHQNMAFILTSSVDIYFYEATFGNSEVTNKTNIFGIKLVKSQKKINGMSESFLKNFKALPSTAGIAYHDTNDKLFLVTDVGVIIVDVKAADGKEGNINVEQQGKGEGKHDGGSNRILKGVFDSRRVLDDDEKDAPKTEEVKDIHGDPAAIDVPMIIVPIDQIKPKKNIVWVDIRGDYLFIGYALSGIDIYHIPQSDKITYIGSVDESYYQDQKNEDGTWGKDKVHNILFYDFNVNDHKVGFGNPDNNTNHLKTCRGCKSFYKIEFTLEQRTDFIKNKIIERPVMFIGSNLGVRALDLTSQFEHGSLRKELYKYQLDIPEAFRVTRFHDQLYVMAKQKDAVTKNLANNWWESMNINKTIYEIFQTDKTLETWDKEDLQYLDQSRLIINREIKSPYNVKSIYTDEDYLYTISDKYHNFYERGIIREFEAQDFNISKMFYDNTLLDVRKVIMNGEDYLIAISRKNISIYKVRLSSPSLSCPVSYFNDVTLGDLYGKFEFVLNTTTRGCPSKLEKHQSGEEKFETVCLFSSTIKLDFVEPWLCKGCNQKDVRNWALIIISIVVVVSLLIFIIYNIRSRSTYKKLEREFGELKEQKATMPHKNARTQM